MVEIVADLASTANATGEETIKIPANTMRLLRQSYDTREKVLDWWLAIFVAGALVYAFRHQLRGFVTPDADPNLGKQPNFTPNQGVGDAFPNRGVNPMIYTYNMPPSRNVRADRGPSGTRTPNNPSTMPEFPDLGG